MSRGASFQPRKLEGKRKITVLGSTGSIGQHTVELLRQRPWDFDVAALVAQRNVALLAEQAKTIRAKLAVVADEEYLPELKERLKGSGVEAAGGMAAVCEAASVPADVVVAGISGFSGLKATMAAIKQGATIALANKESLVAAGDVVLRAVDANNATLIPVDSEHSAIFQVWDPLQTDAVEKVILTASGGPFRKLSFEDMERISPEQALVHPVWSMGAKITIDSATLMNKGLELIEAHYLFHMPANKLDVLVHPESIIHSMVQYHDGSVLAQLGLPDMCTPISYAMAWPERMQVKRPRLDLAAIGKLTFELPDENKFPCLKLARQALAAGGGWPAILNAANEVAVQAFLEGRIAFTSIAQVVEEVLSHVTPSAPQTLADVEDLDSSARRMAGELVIK